MSLRIVFNSVWENPGNRGQRLRRLVRAAVWQIRKRVIGRPRIIELPNGVKFKAYPNCSTSSALTYADWPEFWELRFIRRTLQPSDAILDVGANVGHISLLLADLVGHENIFAFEPTPISFCRLKANWLLNGWSTNHLFNCAVGRNVGTVLISNPTRPDTKSAIGKLDNNMVEVRLVSLDTLRQEWQNRRIGLLTIDVEGYEAEVLAGAFQVLKTDRPRLIMFESLGSSVDPEIARQFERAEYDVFQLDNAGHPDFEHSFAQNLFAVPHERAGSVR